MASQAHDLFQAIAAGDVQAVERCLKDGIDPNAPDLINRTPLIHACERSQYECVRLLLDAGADPNRQNDRGDTALNHLSPTVKEDTPILELLLQRGANPNALGSGGKAPLFRAVEAGRLDWVVSLLKAGADPLQQTTAGQRPLSIAKQREFQEISLLLTDAVRIKLRKIMTGGTAWEKTREQEIAHRYIAGPVEITQIFNFSGHEVREITTHLQTGGTAAQVRPFENFRDKQLLREAEQKLTEMGGIVGDNRKKRPLDFNRPA